VFYTDTSDSYLQHHWPQSFAFWHWKLDFLATHQDDHHFLVFDNKKTPKHKKNTKQKSTKKADIATTLFNDIGA